MSRRNNTRATRCVRLLRTIAAQLGGGMRRLWGALRGARRGVPIEVLVADRTRRRSLERELRTGLGRLQRALGAPLPPHAAIVVQQVIRTERQLPGCYQVGRRPDGSRFALIRLALQVDGRGLETDELLAALAEQCIGLATQETGGSSVLVPVEFESARPAEARRLEALRPDPLVPPLDDHAFPPTQRAA